MKIFSRKVMKITLLEWHELTKVFQQYRKGLFKIKNSIIINYAKGFFKNKYLKFQESNEP